MTHFDCGCETDGSARCDAHDAYWCHSMLAKGVLSGVMCPPCRAEKWRSVSLSPKATPTRGKR